MHIVDFYRKFGEARTPLKIIVAYSGDSSPTTWSYYFDIPKD